ncbi:MAG: FliI/YscN family ATPase [Acetobacteraceae bacterium]|nr:FliI/YscN family ATPase [Acetobacteraceae bacterium]
MLSVGDRLEVFGRDGTAVPAQVTASTAQDTTITLFRDAAALGGGLGAGAPARLPLHPTTATLPIAPGWIGRVVDPLGQPLDGRGALPLGTPQPLRRPAPPAATRARIGPAVTLGVRAMDLFTTCRQGQRMGLFAGPGVGKSTLLGMLARWSAFDTIVVALVGERGREVREFLEDDLGVQGRDRALLFVATADATALMRAEAVHAAMAAAEHFRDRGQHVLLLVDSLTRYCHAVREVALSAGELPVARGYPPSVFAELASLLERAGPGEEQPGHPIGSITGFFTVLVDGDDITEPVADAVRGILDGHVVLSRQIAERGRYPAIDIPRSLSRVATAWHTPDRREALRLARQAMAEAEELEQLARMGLYRQGADPDSDRMLALNRILGDFLRQDTETPADPDEGFAALASLLEQGQG